MALILGDGREVEPADLRAAFDRDGALVIEGFYTAAELVAVNAALDELLAAPPATIDQLRPGHWQQFETNPQQLGEQAAQHPAFLALGAEARLAAGTAAVVGDGYSASSLLVMVTPHGTGQAWHQDTPHDLGPLDFNANRLIYPRDVDPRSGQVVFVPGSHRLGRIPPGDNQGPIPGEQCLAPAAGTLVLRCSRTFHRVTVNETHAPRVSINYRVRPAGAPAQMDAIGVFRNAAYDFRTQQVIDR